MTLALDLLAGFAVWLVLATAMGLFLGILIKIGGSTQ